MKIACVLGMDFEDSEFRIPYDRLKEEGYQVDIIGLKAGEELEGYKGKEKVKAEKSVDQARADDYDALLIPGGYSPDHPRTRPPGPGHRPTLRLHSSDQTPSSLFHVEQELRCACRRPGGAAPLKSGACTTAPA